MRDLQDLPPKEARRLLALAALAVRERETRRQPTMVPLQIPGSEVTNETIRAGVHLLLEERRRAAGMEPVDISELIICDDWRLRHHAIYTDQPASRGADVTSVAGGPASRVHPG
jgi:hypothetical protein